MTWCQDWLKTYPSRWGAIFVVLLLRYSNMQVISAQKMRSHRVMEKKKKRNWMSICGTKSTNTKNFQMQHFASFICAAIYKTYFEKYLVFISHLFVTYLVQPKSCPLLASCARKHFGSEIMSESIYLKQVPQLCAMVLRFLEQLVYFRFKCSCWRFSVE